MPSTPGVKVEVTQRIVRLQDFDRNWLSAEYIRHDHLFGVNGIININLVNICLCDRSVCGIDTALASSYAEPCLVLGRYCADNSITTYMGPRLL